MTHHDRFAPTTLGEHLREKDRGWFGVTEACHRPNDRLRPHAHRYPAITIVRRGSFGLHIGGETVDCRNHGVFFKRGDQRHANEVGRDGARSLILELRADGNRIEQRDLPLPEQSFWTGDPLARQLATGIAREFRSNDVASDIALEGLVLELVARLLRDRAPSPPDAHRPRWLSEVEALLHERFRAGIGLDDVAAHVQRHPAHVARTFRRHHNCSIGEYLRRVRLEFSAELLRDGDRPLAEIAVEAGFYDQAHFGRCFKAWISATPGAYRAARRRAR